jgi:hypothetical protein
MRQLWMRATRAAFYSGAVRDSRNLRVESGVSSCMRNRWRMILPVVGLMLFGAVSYHSFRVKREVQRQPSKYFWWSAIRLDSDPLNKRDQVGRPCGGTGKGCWELRDTWVDPGLLDNFLLLSAFPAFFVGGFAVRSLGGLGVDEVSSFMFLMPVLIAIWYYLIGSLLDRWS